MISVPAAAGQPVSAAGGEGVLCGLG